MRYLTIKKNPGHREIHWALELCSRLTVSEHPNITQYWAGSVRHVYNAEGPQHVLKYIAAHTSAGRLIMRQRRHRNVKLSMRTPVPELYANSSARLEAELGCTHRSSVIHSAIREQTESRLPGSLRASIRTSRKLR